MFAISSYVLRTQSRGSDFCGLLPSSQAFKHVLFIFVHGMMKSDVHDSRLRRDRVVEGVKLRDGVVEGVQLLLEFIGVLGTDDS
jgi:hypothetical protein